jgi:hypothetical protein
MPKILLEFSEDEVEEAQTAIHAGSYKAALWDLDQWLRRMLKYEELSESEQLVYTSVRAKLHEVSPEDAL